MFSREAFATKSKLAADHSPDSLKYIPAILNEFLLLISSSHNEEDWFTNVKTQLDVVAEFFYPSQKLPYSVSNLFNFIEKKSQELAEDLLQKSFDSFTATTRLCDFVREELIDRYLVLTAPLICSQLQKRIQSLTKIMIYGFNDSILEAILSSENKNLQIVVIDSAPEKEASRAARLLKDAGFDVEYSILNCANHIFNDLSLLLLAAESAFIDGALISNAGALNLALLAKSHSVPIAAICETIRFTDSVSADFTDNLMKTQASEKNWFTNIGKKSEDNCDLEIIQAQWDLINSELIDCLVTEMGPIPPSSVPVIIKEYAAQ